MFSNHKEPNFLILIQWIPAGLSGKTGPEGTEVIQEEPLWGNTIWQILILNLETPGVSVVPIGAAKILWGYQQAEFSKSGPTFFAVNKTQRISPI